MNVKNAQVRSSRKGGKEKEIIMTTQSLLKKHVVNVEECFLFQCLQRIIQRQTIISRTAKNVCLNSKNIGIE